MNVANLSLCKELYELSGWIPAEDKDSDTDGLLRGLDYPDYDLSYLLRKLPPRIVLSQRAGNSWDADCYCGVVDGKEVKDTSVYMHDNSPEDAVAKLAIALFKQGILTKA